MQCVIFEHWHFILPFSSLVPLPYQMQHILLTQLVGQTDAKLTALSIVVVSAMLFLCCRQTIPCAKYYLQVDLQSHIVSSCLNNVYYVPEDMGFSTGQYNMPSSRYLYAQGVNSLRGMRTMFALGMAPADWLPTSLQVICMNLQYSQEGCQCWWRHFFGACFQTMGEQQFTSCREGTKHKTAAVYLQDCACTTIFVLCEHCTMVGFCLSSAIKLSTIIPVVRFMWRGMLGPRGMQCIGHRHAMACAFSQQHAPTRLRRAKELFSTH